MANKSEVLLAFEDEPVTEKHKDLLNFTVNKIGGTPDHPRNIHLNPPKCPLCHLTRPLVLQIYAPLNPVVHRTLYLFACVNPNCWSLSESWLCIRVQTQEELIDTTESVQTPAAPGKTSATDWCSEADDWGEDNANGNEENGNLISINLPGKVSDEEEESCSLEDSIQSSFGNLTVDDKNANKGAQVGAVGRLHSPLATAEIEGNEGEAITIDTPTYPQRDVAALLQEAASLPPEICRGQTQGVVQFQPYFLSVWEEGTDKSSMGVSDVHVKELLQDYQMKTAESTDSSGPDSGGGDKTGGDEAYEKYEKSHPAHGDKMFHHFLSKVQANSGQLLRYSRESTPLLLYPLQELPKKCQYCQGEMVFEFQVIPTIISKLQLITDSRHVARLEFGTVLIYTCKKSCWSTDTSFRVETAILQNEVY
ncbi:unnamed protein product [Acanthoscelides obtectus]|uniref:Programmed cell death protein 2 C-terminal domain-containing protein n=1 Tax=Acanthoscelides obtectus TaxID=200917 RepID=A0A9P0KN76_ACAOB|nr:unnamed protein product [Acanthoscelides obtectus]CAK1664764.1 Programmed cell death protein 2-like [Acanthoscelides obtectus]